jgi:hypothetical protein
VGVFVLVGVLVGVFVLVGVLVGVEVSVGVLVGVDVSVGVFVGVDVSVGVLVAVAVSVGVLVAVLVAVLVPVAVGVGVRVGAFGGWPGVGNIVGRKSTTQSSVSPLIGKRSIASPDDALCIWLLIPGQLPLLYTNTSTTVSDPSMMITSSPLFARLNALPALAVHGAYGVMSGVAPVFTSSKSGLKPQIALNALALFATTASPSEASVAVAKRIIASFPPGVSSSPIL